MYTCTRFGSTYCQLTDDILPALLPAFCAHHMASHAGSASGRGSLHPDIVRLVEGVVAWQNANDAQRIPTRKAQDSNERNLGMRLANLLLRSEQV